ncbi:cell adhesion molecule 3-like [Thrips palmi]|uniref:Cell adhesion molecule 3-like n=1 Tax=Thrips palmi TaxID=161013 RepID=A0A6P8ZJ31_THRPL|nr:cell adhesion molecule 3-like [Thrips palmi]
MATPVLQIVAVSVLSLIALTPTDCGALLIRALRVPAWTQLHQPAVLSCQYDAQGEPLYSVKWYRNRQEFYRYLKDEAPNIRTFTMNGVHVDVAQSNDTTLRLSNVSFDTAGEYTCEVSVDAPTFLTAVSSARLNVVAMPPKGPHISGLDSAYVPGQTIVANCSIGPAVPRATLRWYLNGVELDHRNLVAPTHGADPPARSATPTGWRCGCRSSPRSSRGTTPSCAASRSSRTCRTATPPSRPS